MKRIVKINPLGYRLTRNDYIEQKNNLPFIYPKINDFFEFEIDWVKNDILLNRYIKCCDMEDNIDCTYPAHQQFIENLVDPLATAKKCFTLGLFGATIEMCGHFGELLAILCLLVTNKSSSSTEREKVERKRQSERIQELTKHYRSESNLIVEFTEINNSRREYFHNLKITNNFDYEAKAINVYKCACQLFAELASADLLNQKEISEIIAFFLNRNLK